jgi:hypothetical protein
MASNITTVGEALRSLPETGDRIGHALRSSGFTGDAEALAGVISEVKRSGLVNRPALEQLHKICKRLGNVKVTGPGWAELLGELTAAVSTLRRARP